MRKEKKTKQGDGGWETGIACLLRRSPPPSNVSFFMKKNQFLKFYYFNFIKANKRQKVYTTFA